MELPVLVEKSSVVEVVSVLLDHLDPFETSCFLDDGAIQDRVVECGVVSCCIGVFLSKG